MNRINFAEVFEDIKNHFVEWRKIAEKRNGGDSAPLLEKVVDEKGDWNKKVFSAEDGILVATKMYNVDYTILTDGKCHLKLFSLVIYTDNDRKEAKVKITGSLRYRSVNEMGEAHFKPYILIKYSGHNCEMAIDDVNTDEETFISFLGNFTCKGYPSLFMRMFHALNND